ncbi:MAG: response regulator [Magnetococcales bacterium]|nr:response regulator [Magnetococcales bacterium]NGZ06523.1 response regulator [Magnetococcales bacterium]
MNTLIVDDIPENRALLADILKPFSHCDVATNGMEAVEIFEAELMDGNPYDLVLLDIMMPIMDGQEALKRMRALEESLQIHEDNRTAIIMVTAVDAMSEISEAFDIGGCTDYLNKPITRGKLLVKLAEHDLIPKEWWKH